MGGKQPASRRRAKSTNQNLSARPREQPTPFEVLAELKAAGRVPADVDLHARLPPAPPSNESSEITQIREHFPHRPSVPTYHDAITFFAETVPPEQVMPRLERLMRKLHGEVSNRPVGASRRPTDQNAVSGQRGRVCADLRGRRTTAEDVLAATPTDRTKTHKRVDEISLEVGRVVAIGNYELRILRVSIGGFDEPHRVQLSITKRHADASVESVGTAMGQFLSPDGMTIGRSAANWVQLDTESAPGVSTVSAVHAEIYYDPDAKKIMIRDGKRDSIEPTTGKPKRSTNGLFVRRPHTKRHTSPLVRSEEPIYVDDDLTVMDDPTESK